ncbi:MAG: nuclear transport factor 2 family protein [Planctomycetota bacterium]|jgi:hypothetical protein
MNQHLRLAVSACSALLALGCAHLDLSSPRATVVGFTNAAASGRADLAQAYFLPDAVDYDDIKEVLTAAPGSPRHPARVMLESIDPQTPIEIVSEEQTPNGLKVVWQVTFRRDFEIQGQSIAAGSTYNLDATLRQSGDQWMIDNL